MCGILGLYQTNQFSAETIRRFKEAVNSMSHRGPDDEGYFNHGHFMLGHRRLSIIDLSESAHQPMSDETDRYTIVYNGEIFNFLELRQYLKDTGHSFQSLSDTEVLLKLFILLRENCLEKLNGFFSFAIYDKIENELFIARDRYGIKPLYYYSDSKCFAFSSEIRPLKRFGLPSEIDLDSLQLYLQLNYIPPPYCIFKNYKKVKPGHYIKLKVESNGTFKVSDNCWYTIPKLDLGKENYDYDSACKTLYGLIDSAVFQRLISDVPIGSFLSGGLDSSIITAIAARHHKKLQTFTIGFADDNHFDETAYSIAVSEFCGTNHTTFNLSKKDIIEAISELSDNIDEPFADSSALAVYLLSKKTKNYASVVLSGDGSDELFAGYQKHRAEWIVRNNKIYRILLPIASHFIQSFSGSRNSFIGNKIRQIHRFARASNLHFRYRYWSWCSISNYFDAVSLLSNEIQLQGKGNHEEIINNLTPFCSNEIDFNDVLRNDFSLILPGDMLTKIDVMPMASSIEVRSPFLDHNVVDFAFQLPSKYKIDSNNQKIILKDTFGHLLPKKILNRPKKGFEIPLSTLMRSEYKSHIHHLLSPEKIKSQGIFEENNISHLLDSLKSNTPTDKESQVWNLYIFQLWWNKINNES